MKVGLYLACHPGVFDDWNYSLPPLGPGYLAAYARTKLEGVEFFARRSLDDLIAEKPDLVGITFTTYNTTVAVNDARRIKDELGIPVICGGPHVSTLPTILDRIWDCAVLGEGEETFAELVQLLKDRGRYEASDLRKVQGLLFHDEDGSLQRTPSRPAIQDLDSIPYPDRDMLYQFGTENQWGSSANEIQILTSRGCPYDCSFCSTVKHWGTKYRFPSTDYVVGEIELIKEKYGPKLINIFDDLFVVRKQRVIDILREVRRRGLHHGTNFTAFVRSNLLDDEIMEEFAKTNFDYLNIGLESGSDATLKTFNKQASSREKNEHAIELGRRHGVKYASCFILGAPNETRADILDTFEFVQNSMDVMYYVEFVPLTVYPGTQFWYQAKSKFGYTDEDILPTVSITDQDVEDSSSYLRNRWVYLNDENIPREEFITYLKLGVNLGKATWKYQQMKKELDSVSSAVGNVDHVAANLPISDLIGAKIKRRLRKLMPMGDRYHSWDDATAKEHAEGVTVC